MPTRKQAAIQLNQPGSGGGMTGFAYPETEALRATLGGPLAAPGMTVFHHDNRIKQTSLGNVPGAALMHRIQSGEFDARQQLITANLRAVLENNKRYAHNGVGIFDLLKAGNQGLVHALENFPCGNEEHFLEYVSACIRHHIGQALKLERHPAQRTPGQHQTTPASAACPS
jgi:hypothetical protein